MKTPHQIATLAAALFTALPLCAQQPAPQSVTVFSNVRIFDGKSGVLSAPSHVLVRGKVIEKISTAPIPTDRRADTKIIDGGGRTLMPGLIDAHTHLMFCTISQTATLTSDIGFINVAAVKCAHEMLLRGFTSVRDLGGPVFGLKKGIDTGLVPGPRIWPCGAFISQTGGHGDFRLPNDMPAQPGQMTFSERVNAAAIADDPGTVRQRVREQLALGATQIKLMAGGGVSSSYDPLDVTQYSVEELRAAVEAAENWGTYVTVHAYTPKATRQCLEAGVKCIDHGQLLDEDTVKLMAEKGVWWSLQPFVDDKPSAFPEGSPNRKKQLTMFAGTDNAYMLAKKYKVKTALGDGQPLQCSQRHTPGALNSRTWSAGTRLLRSSKWPLTITPNSLPSPACAVLTRANWASWRKVHWPISCSWMEIPSPISSWSLTRRKISSSS
jgi:imidazolonepropionase-like amidohydrolase